MSVVLKIKKLIESEKINVNAFSKAVGISPKGVYKWTDESIKVYTLLKVSEFFNKPVSYFLGVESEIKTKNSKKANVHLELDSNDILKIDLKNKRLEILKK